MRAWSWAELGTEGEKKDGAPTLVKAGAEAGRGTGDHLRCTRLLHLILFPEQPDDYTSSTPVREGHLGLLKCIRYPRKL